MQTKDVKKQGIDYSQNGDEDLIKTNRIHVILPSAIIILFSAVPVYVLYIFAYLISVFGNHDLPIHGLYRMLSTGLIHVLFSIIFSILWLKNIKWSRYPIMILAIISTLSLILISLFDWLVVALLLDVYLFWALFFAPKQK